MFSVIIPMYNVERYILQCLTSVIKQTYEKFEVLAIDDGSCDETVHIVSDVMKEDIRIKLFKARHGGPANARNIGIENAQGDYITFLDADDFWEITHLEHLNEWVEDCDMCVANSHTNFSATNLCGVRLFEFNEKNKYSKQEARRIITDCKSRLPGATWLNTYKREFLKKNGLQFNSKLIYSEDLDFFLNALELAETINFYPYNFYYYRTDNKNSEIHTLNADKLLCIGGIYKNWFDYYALNKSDKTVSDNMCQRLAEEFRNLILDLHRIPDNDCKKTELKRFIKASKKIYNGSYQIGNTFLAVYYIRYFMRKVKWKWNSIIKQ
jgi:Glycosyltransferases involved in cell wall biogenesis